MYTEIDAEIFAVQEKDELNFKKKLKKIMGINFRTLNGMKLKIELKQEISILNTLKFCRRGGADSFLISAITDYGFTFYIADRWMGESFILISHDNIKAIHWLTQENIEILNMSEEEARCHPRNS